MTIKKGDKLVPMAGGLARANKLTPEQRSAIARKAVLARHYKCTCGTDKNNDDIHLPHCKSLRDQEKGSEILPIKPAKL